MKKGGKAANISSNACETNLDFLGHPSNSKIITVSIKLNAENENNKEMNFYVK